MSGIESMEDLDGVIRLIGRIDLALDADENELNVKLQALKKEYLERSKRLRDEREVLLVRVQAYVREHRDEVLAGKKSAKLNFGKVGWRKTKDTIPLPRKGTDEMTELVASLERVREQEDRFRRIRIHRTEWIRRGDLARLSDEDLAALGLERRKGGDLFFVEPDRERLKELEGPRPVIATEAPA
jgi:phage host-nuclease inhibitor protein Gam